MKISVIVPIFKVEKYLVQCIDSIISQTFSDLEIILVDDGSPDNCPAICDEFALKDNRIKVIHKQNGGLIAARKSGVEIATGEYITFVDGDDWVASDMYQKVSDAINVYQADCVITQFYFAYEMKNTVSQYLLDKPYYDREAMEREIFPKMLYAGKWYQFGVFPNCWTKVFRADILKKHIFEVDDRIRLGEDIAFTYPCLMDCQSVAFVDEPLYYYRQNPESMTATYDKRLPDIYRLPFNAIKTASEQLQTDISDQLPYYLLYLINFVVRNEAESDKSSITVIHNLLKNNRDWKNIGFARLPMHIQLLLLALKLNSSILMNVYKSVMKKHIASTR